MFTSLIDRYKNLRSAKPANEADQALNQSYLYLNQAKRNRSFVEVSVAGDDVVYQSMILELDPQERTILIDELFPVGFIGMVGQAVQLRIRQPEGRKLKFDAVIQQQHHYDDAPLYVLEMPREIEVDQRRRAYRLPIGNKVAISSHFIGPNQVPYQAQVRNLSSTGMGLEVAIEDSVALNYNDLLSHVMLDFAGVNIECEMAVRSVAEEPERQSLLIGAEFVDLPALEQRVLEKSIMRIQRQRINYGSELESQLAGV